MTHVEALAEAMADEIAWYEERIKTDKPNRMLWKRNLLATTHALERLKAAMQADAQAK